MALQLFIGNKNYSSWSMRPWVLMTQAGIPFEEVMVRFDSFEADSSFKKHLRGVNPVGKVPVLIDDGFAVWDTLAIAEYLAERFPEKTLWPADPKQRARARSCRPAGHTPSDGNLSCRYSAMASVSQTEKPSSTSTGTRPAGLTRATVWRKAEPSLKSKRS